MLRNGLFMSSGVCTLMRAVCGSVPWKLLYTEDFVLIEDTQEEGISKLKAWKAGNESKGHHLNINKTEFLASDAGHGALKKYLLPAVMVLAATPPSAHSASSGSTRGAMASLDD